MSICEEYGAFKGQMKQSYDPVQDHFPQATVRDNRPNSDVNALIYVICQDYKSKHMYYYR